MHALTMNLKSQCAPTKCCLLKNVIYFFHQKFSSYFVVAINKVESYKWNIVLDLVVSNTRLITECQMVW